MGRPGGLFRQGAQGAVYTVLYAWERHRPSRAASLLDLAGEQTHLTTVVRIPLEVAAPLVEAVRRLPGADDQYVYPVSDLHLTVLNLDHVAAAALPESIAKVEAVLADTTSFEVRLRGLGMSAQSIYAQVFDCSGALRVLRKRLSHITGARPTPALRHLGFVNVARYLAPDVERLRDGVHAARQVPFGTLLVTAVEIVRTDKVLSHSGTTLLSSVRLTGAT